jgi:hypothetical protein
VNIVIPRRKQNLVRGPDALFDLNQAVNRVLEGSFEGHDGRVVEQKSLSDAKVVHGDPLGADRLAHHGSNPPCVSPDAEVCGYDEEQEQPQHNREQHREQHRALLARKQRRGVVHHHCWERMQLFDCEGEV